MIHDFLLCKRGEKERFGNYKGIMRVGWLYVVKTSKNIHT